MKIQEILFSMFIFLGTPVALLAQNSGIVGTLTDQSGAVLPGATVAATNVATGAVRTTVTNASGQYAILKLEAGVFRVTAELPGFQRQVADKVQLEVQSVTEINMVLTVGEINSEVVVEGGAAKIRTSESDVSTLIENKLVSELPLNGRNFLQLQTLGPGVVAAQSSTFSRVKIDSQSLSLGGGGAFNVNGQRSIFNNFLLDGVSFKEWVHGSNGMNPSVDAIQEFRTQASNYSAEFGSDAGGQVNMVVKSGSNKFHGTVYEFLRNERFDAANFFTNQAGLKKDPLSRHQFGGTIGGPILKDRTFFFFSFDAFREERGSTLTAAYPNAAMRGGNFSELLALSSPIIVKDPLTDQQFPGNIVPSSRILSAWPSYFDKYLPLPNRTGLANNFVTPAIRVNNVDQFLIRLDHRLSGKTSLMARYIFNDVSNDRPRLNPNFGYLQLNQNHQAVVSAQRIIGPTKVLDLRTAWNLFFQDEFNTLGDQIGRPDITKGLFGIKGTSLDPRSADAPGFNASGFSALGGGGSMPRAWISERYEEQGTFSMILGSHNLRMGMQAIRHRDTFPEIFLPNGVYVFDGRFTGYSLADMLLGAPRRYRLSPELFDPQFRYWELMPWFQDDWRISRNLTLNLGVRYEWVGRPFSKTDDIANIRLSIPYPASLPAPGAFGQASLALAGPCEPSIARKCETSLPTSMARTRSTLNNDNNSFAPRVGFAYKIGGSERTVLRAAYGIFYQRETINQSVFLSLQPPFVSFHDFFLDTTNFRDFDFFDPTRGQKPGGIAFEYIPEDYPDAYLQAWNLTIQRELPGAVVMDLGYVGNKASKLPARMFPNQAFIGSGPVQARRPYSNAGAITAAAPAANSNYHSFQLKVEKRFSKGLSFLSSYTFSKAITDSPGAESTEDGLGRNPQNGRDLRSNRGLFPADARHRYTVSYLYELPFGRGKRYGGGTKGVASKLVSGWQLAGIATFQSGQPLGVALSFDNPNVGEGSKFPDRIGNPNNGPKTVDKFFNTEAFGLPPPLTFGNAGVTPVIGPGINVVDFSIIKNTRITEDVNFQFRAEFFNLANHLVMNQPGSSTGGAVFGTPQFGQVRSTRIDSREIQFAFRLQF